ncbi:SCO2523 family variant P-loop protein [Actinospica robiniae]|uniref:SCO2523 family variant P-loop protein n=1 Tax=Actinospica robiniae TaxID=304901 RepID=UPI0004086635|nr:SCO2523 family variant P-loop protein [Actinospica robiniae]
MLVFCLSAQGGVGTTVTAANLAYHSSLTGVSTCLVDLGFPSPAADLVFDIEPGLRHRLRDRGLNAYLYGRAAEPLGIDVWANTERRSLDRLLGAGAMVLYSSAGEALIQITDSEVSRFADFLFRLEETFDVSFVDLGPGRSALIELALLSVAVPYLRSARTRWLVFHRWSRYEVLSTAQYVFGDHGLVRTGIACGLDSAELEASLEYVRVAAADLDAGIAASLRPAQLAWQLEMDRDLERLASLHRIGRDVRLGSIPQEPVLLRREQLITSRDVYAIGVANQQTLYAYRHLASMLRFARFRDEER